jgi:hypothetical protein
MVHKLPPSGPGSRTLTIVYILVSAGLTNSEFSATLADRACSCPQLCEHGPAITQASAHALQFTPLKVAGLHEGQVT